MSVQKINGKLHIVGKIKKDDGTYYNYKKVANDCKKRTEASEYELDFRRSYQDILISKKQISFQELCNEMQINDKSIKTVTKRTDKDVLDKVCKSFGDKKINLITRKMLQKFINDMEKVYSASYVSKMYYTTKKAFNYAVDHDLIEINPITKVKRAIRKDEVKKEMLFWEPEQFKRFIDVVNNDQLNVFFTFLYYMGVRKGEALALQWKDIDFNSNTVSIYKSMTNKVTGKPWTITSPKTKNSIRNISMPAGVKEKLKIFKESEKQICEFNEECFVFGFYRPLAAETIRRKLDRYISILNTDEDGNEVDSELQTPRIRIHDFRHSHASYLINNKSDRFTDYDIAKRLGDTVQTLHDIYAHWFKQADKGIIDFMDNDI